MYHYCNGSCSGASSIGPGYGIGGSSRWVKGGTVGYSVAPGIAGGTASGKGYAATVANSAGSAVGTYRNASTYGYGNSSCVRATIAICSGYGISSSG